MNAYNFLISVAQYYKFVGQLAPESFREIIFRAGLIG